MRSGWLNIIPSFSDPGKPPEGSVSDVPGLGEIASRLAAERRDSEAVYKDAVEKERVKILHPCPPHPRGFDHSAALKKLENFKKQKERDLRNRMLPKIGEVSAMREMILRESIFLLHKALHVLGVAEKNVDSGMRTWSLCDGYQAALFSAKALLGLCGVSVAEVDSRSLIIDIFADIDVRGNSIPSISFVKAVLDHKSIWQMLQRIFRVTKCALWPSDAVAKLQIGDVKRFARQRNEIHYSNSAWPLADLQQFLTEGAFGEIRFWDSSDEDLVERSDISLVLGYYLVRMALAMLGDLEDLSAKLTPEMEVFRSSVQRDRHPLYYESLSVQCA